MLALLLLCCHDVTNTRVHEDKSTVMNGSIANANTSSAEHRPSTNFLVFTRYTAL